MVSERTLTTKQDTAIVKQDLRDLFQNTEAEDFEIPIGHLVQSIEGQKYPNIQPGEWVNKSTGESLSGRKFMLVASVKERVAWWAIGNSAGESGLHSRYAREEDVPDDLKADVNIVINADAGSSQAFDLTFPNGLTVDANFGDALDNLTIHTPGGDIQGVAEIRI